MNSLSKLEYVNCNVCEKDDAITFFRENNYTVVKCKNCGLVYVNPRPMEKEHNSNNMQQDEYSKYIRNYINNQTAHSYSSHKILKELENIYPEKGKLLEVGCASGYFLKSAREKGWQVEGIEPEYSMAKYAIEKLNLKVRISSIEKAQLPKNHFDVIIAINVLSHLLNPNQILKKFNFSLKSNGILVIQTGNKGSMLSKKKAEILGEFWLTPEHLYHFSENSLVLLLKKTGFKVKCMKRTHVVEHMFSEGILTINRSSKGKWYIKKLFLKYSIIRKFSTKLLKYYYSVFLNSDVCSLLCISEKK